MDACHRLRARIRHRRGQDGLERLTPIEEQLVFEFGVRPLQYRLRLEGRRPQILLRLWDRLPRKALRQGADPTGALRCFRFVENKLVDLGRSPESRYRSWAQVHMMIRPGKRTVRLELVDDMGERELLGRVLTFRVKGDRLTLVRESLLSL